jgi:hypothetical protein
MEDRGSNHWVLAEATALAWLNDDREKVIQGFEAITKPDIASFIAGMALYAITTRGTEKDAYDFIRRVINPHMARNGNAAYWTPDETEGTC